MRAAVRGGRWTTTTHGLARGYVQASVAILPEKYAFDFLRFCQRNPKPPAARSDRSRRSRGQDGGAWQ
ncbi:MAG: hypothetical protein Q8K93_12900 [Reyranella sp.]|nr:hypothetical protein [Reyranella sp.]